MIKGCKKFKITSKKRFIIILFLLLLTVFRVLMISNLPMGVQMDRYIDQELMLRLSKSMISGEYLGEYSDLTLVKGIVYPLFMMLCHFSRIPFYVFFTLFYILSVFILVMSLKKHLKFSALVILYLALLFNPVSYGGQTFMEVYRNSLGMSTVLLFISGMIMIYNSKDSRYKLVLSSLFLGLIIALISNTREDGIWMAPVLFVFVILMFLLMKHKRLMYVCMLFLLFIPLLQMNSIIKYMNRLYYDVSYVNELKEGYYPKALLDIYQIDVGDRARYHVFTRKGMLRAFEVSNTLSEIERELSFKIAKDGWYYLNSTTMWRLREYIYEIKEFKNGKEADEFFKRVYEELENAYESGEIKRDKHAISIFMNYVDKKDIIPIIKKTFYSAYYSVTYKDLRFYYVRMNEEEIGELFNSTTNKDINSDKYNINFKIFNVFLKIYKTLFPILTIVALIKYVIMLVEFVWKKKNSTILLISTLTLISYFTLLFIMSYTDTITAETIIPYYLVPVYSLQVLFTILMCVIIFKKNKSNNEIFS